MKRKQIRTQFKKNGHNQEFFLFKNKLTGLAKSVLETA